MKKYLKISALALAIVYASTALGAQFDRFDNNLYTVCINGQPKQVKGYDVNRRLAEGGTLGGCY